MTFTPYPWQNLPLTTTPLDASHLQTAEQNIVAYFEAGGSSKVPTFTGNPADDTTTFGRGTGAPISGVSVSSPPTLGQRPSATGAGNVVIFRDFTLDPRDDGCAFDGVTDDRAKFALTVLRAAAFITATGKGAVIQMPAGITSFGSGVAPTGYANCGVPLPVNLAGMLTIRGQGRGVTSFLLSDACRNVFWINKSADYDTFQNVTFEDFDVDNNNTVGRCHILIGNMPSASTPQIRLNYATLRHHRINFRNIPVDLSGATSAKTNIGYFCDHAGALEATQTTATDIVVEDVNGTAGANGIVCASLGAGSLVGGTNHFYDKIFIRRCNFTRAAAASGSASQTDFYVCGTGFGDRFEIIDCSSTNSGDDAFEIGAMQRGLIADCTATDAFLESILFRNTHAASNVTEQRIVVRNFTHRTTSNVSQYSGAQMYPVSWIADNSNAFGTFEFEGLDVQQDGVAFSRQGKSSLALLFDNATVVERRSFDRLKVRITNYSYDGGSTIDAAIIDNQSTSGTITIKDLDIAATVTTTGVGGLNLSGVSNRGATNLMSVTGCVADLSGCRLTTGGGIFIVSAGRGGGNATHTSIRGLVPKGNYGSTGVGNRPIGIGTSTTLSAFQLSDSDFSQATNLSADVSYSAGVNDQHLFIGANVVSAAGNVMMTGRRGVAAATTILPQDGIVAHSNTTSAYTDTLPAGSTMPPGHVIEIVDESGLAATNNITVQRAGADTFTDGTTSKVINTNFGTLKVYWNPSVSKWQTTV